MICLMLVCTQPMLAAKTAVRAPTIATTFDVSGARLKSGLDRATMYTPAVTMVAAWIRAEVGVGPSLASGSHTDRGNWALFPRAPTKRARVITVARVDPGASTCSARGKT